MIGEYIGGAVVILLVILILAVLASCIKIVPQAHGTDCGASGRIHWNLVGRTAFQTSDRGSRWRGRVNLKEQVIDFKPQPVITKDNVTMQIDTVVFFQITDPEAVRLRCGESADGHREPDGYHASEYHR